MQTRHINPNHFAAQRVATGFPRDASRWRQFILFLALVPMCFIRHKIGERLVSVPRILAMDALLLLYALVFAMLYGANVEEQGAVFAGGIWFVIIFTIVAAIHRTLRWVRRQGGEQLETRCMGLSWFGFRHPNGNAERYIDIVFAVSQGFAYLFLGDSELVVAGSWLLISSAALFVSENYIHALHLDRQDALLNAEAHEQIAAMHLEEQGTSSVKAMPQTPIPTGLDSNLTRHLQKQASQASFPTPTVSQAEDVRNDMAAQPATASAVRPVARSTELAELQYGIKRLLFGEAKTDRERFINGVVIVTCIVAVFLYLLAH